MLVRFLIAASLLLSLSPLVFSQNIIVGWGGDTVSNSTDLNGFSTQSQLTGLNINPPSRAGRLINPPGTDNVSTDTIIGIPFSETVPLSPTSGYTGQRFYGGLSSGQLNPGAPSPIDRAQISNSGPTDVLDFRYALSNTQHDSRLAVFFDKADFLAGGNTKPVQFSTSSSLNITFKSNTSNQVNNDGELRWIVREAGQWWISAANSAGQPNIRSQDDASIGIQNNRSFTSTFASGELSYWAPFNPASGGGLLNLNFEPIYTSRFVIDSGSNPFVLKSFTDITGLGFYIEGDQFSTNVFQFEVASMNFNMLVVPEPGAYVLVSVLGVGYVALRNMRNKKPAAPAEAKTEEETTTEQVVAV